MPANNHATLGEALNLYRAAMGRLVEERLKAAYKQAWWEDGVLRKLPEGMRANLRRDTERLPEQERAAHIDVNHIEKIVVMNFDTVFEAVFGDFKRTQSRLATVTLARNRWAHPGRSPDQQDLPADEVGHDLYDVAQLLEVAKLPEAPEVERLRRHVLGMTGEPEAAPVQQVRPASANELPYWWQVCEPQDAFKNPAEVDESLFAATLGGVFAGAARSEYLKPEVFFSHTYFTENLVQTIRDVASRLGGGPGPSVTEMQTPFGGGKTHALLTLYHLISSPEESLAVAGVREALGDIAIPTGARVLVFDGQEFGADSVEKENGAAVATLWGELAFQASPSLFHRLVESSDSDGIAPGNAIFRQVLEAAAPCLILIDELVSYLVKLKFSNARRVQNLYRQTLQFVQEVLQQAGNVTGVSVLISLPKSVREWGGLDPAQVQRELGIVDELLARTDRVVSKRTPVNDDEIYTLMSRRLFKVVDRGAAERAARMYRDAYERTRALYDPTVLSPEYLANQVACYPLHPELIDVLYKKWSTATDFPRTRTVLQLLASIVADQWLHRREAYSIQSAHVNLERERIRTKIVSAAGAGGGYDAVVAADIIGGDAHADMQDDRRGGDYERFHIARGMATTLLMHSFGGTTSPGALLPELRLGTVAPNVGPEYVTEVLNSLEQSLWYVHREGDRLRFETRANVYRVIAERADAQPEASVMERLGESIAAAIGQVSGFRAPPEWVGMDGSIADRPEPTIAVLHPKYCVSREGGDEPLSGRDRIDSLFERVGGGLRQWRNALVLVAPDAELWQRTDSAARAVMAYETVLADAQRKRLSLSELELKELLSRFNAEKESLRTSIVTAYRWAFYPGDESLDVVDLPVPATKDERIAGRVAQRLVSQDYGAPKVLDRMSAVYFESKFAPRLWKDESSPLDLGELSRRLMQWTYLPILPKREEALRECVREGLQRKLWSVAVGDNSTGMYRALIEDPDQLGGVAALFDGTASLVRGVMRDLIREQLRLPPLEAPTPPPGSEPPPVGRVGPLPPLAPTPPPAPRRFSRVRLELTALPIGKTGNLQPYLFKPIQDQDAGAELSIVIEIKSGAGLSAEILDGRIVEGFEQLGISVTWEAEP